MEVDELAGGSGPKGKVEATDSEDEEEIANVPDSVLEDEEGGINDIE